MSGQVRSHVHSAGAAVFKTGVCVRGRVYNPPVQPSKLLEQRIAAGDVHLSRGLFHIELFYRPVLDQH